MRFTAVFHWLKWAGIFASVSSLLVPATAVSEIIPESRRINWREAAGVPGGIPNRTTIFTTLSPGATTAQINSAIASCPSNQVVFLNAGTYNNIGTINFATRRGVTLRGAGPGLTIINSVATGACVTGDQYGFTGARNITGSYAKGASNVVVASTTSLAVGNLIQISQADNLDYVFSSQGPARNMIYTHKVTGISGSAVTFWPPLVTDLNTSLTPQMTYLNGGPGLVMSGIENMTINNGGGASDMIYWVAAQACWIKNVELVNGESQFVFWVNCLQCEMRHCTARDVAGFPSNPDGFGIYIYGKSSFCLVEDNIFKNVGVAILQTASSGNAFLFNYATNMSFANWTHQTGAYNAGHGAHPMMCLWEGNVGEQWQHDGYHGSASHQTLFRNWIHGLSRYSDNRKMVDITRGSYYYNVVGNVLGDARWTNDPGFSYEMTGSPGYNQQSVMYRLGYPNVANNGFTQGNPWPATYGLTYPDAKSKNTLLRHGNYDWKNRGVVWDSSIPDQNLPDSLFYSSKPAYFGTCPWPPYNPASPSTASVTNIPAGYRFVFGTDPATNNLAPPGSLRIVGP